MPARRNDTPSGRVRHRFIQALAAELTGVWKRRWNEEMFIVFHMVNPQHVQHVTKFYEIRRRIDCRLDAWEAGEHEILVEDTAHTCAHYLSNTRGEDSSDHMANIYHSLVLRGKMCLAVFWMTEREKGGVLHPEETCTKTGKFILEVLRSKHPEARPLTAQSL